MTSDSPEHAVKMVDEAFNRGDLEGVLSFYEASAVVVREPGSFVRGHEELRNFFTGVMRAATSDSQAAQNQHYRSRWRSAILVSMDSQFAGRRRSLGRTVGRQTYPWPYQKAGSGHVR